MFCLLALYRTNVLVKASARSGKGRGYSATFATARTASKFFFSDLTGRPLAKMGLEFTERPNVSLGDLMAHRGEQVSYFNLFTLRLSLTFLRKILIIWPIA